MKNHDKEVLMIEKQYNGFSNLRQGLQKAIDDHALSWFRKKKKSAGNKFKKTAQVIKAATTFQNREKRDLPRPVIRYRREINNLSNIWDEVFKTRTSKIYERQPLCGSFRRAAPFVEHLRNKRKSIIKLQNKKIK